MIKHVLKTALRHSHYRNNGNENSVIPSRQNEKGIQMALRHSKVDCMKGKFPEYRKHIIFC